MTPEIAAGWSALLAAVATVVGGVLLLGASMSFLVVLGTRLVTDDIVAPAWNA
jgi:hypothetical protein